MGSRSQSCRDVGSNLCFNAKSSINFRWFSVLFQYPGPAICYSHHFWTIYILRRGVLIRSAIGGSSGVVCFCYRLLEIWKNEKNTFWNPSTSQLSSGNSCMRALRKLPPWWFNTEAPSWCFNTELFVTEYQFSGLRESKSSKSAYSSKNFLLLDSSCQGVLSI